MSSLAIGIEPLESGWVRLQVEECHWDCSLVPCDSFEETVVALVNALNYGDGLAVWNLEPGILELHFGKREFHITLTDAGEAESVFRCQASIEQQARAWLRAFSSLMRFESSDLSRIGRELPDLELLKRLLRDKKLRPS